VLLCVVVFINIDIGVEVVVLLLHFPLPSAPPFTPSRNPFFFLVVLQSRDFVRILSIIDALCNGNALLGHHVYTLLRVHMNQSIAAYRIFSRLRDRDRLSKRTVAISSDLLAPLTPALVEPGMRKLSLIHNCQRLCMP